MEALVALAGQVVGTSLSPEMWIAVVAVVAFGRNTSRFFIALAMAALGLVAFRALLIPDYPVQAALAAILALSIWSLLGALIRARLTRRRSD